MDKFRCKSGIVGITGGIGAGKSVVSRLLRLLGFHVYDCDLNARLLMDSDPGLVADVASRLGSECVMSDGSLCREAIAARIFSDVEARSWLNARVHEMVRKDFIAFARARIDSDKPVFVEAAVMKTSGLWRLCDSIWIVEAPESLRIARVVSRNGISEAEVRARIESQRDEFDFFGLIPSSAIRFIVNDGVTPLLPQLSNQDYCRSL